MKIYALGAGGMLGGYILREIPDVIPAYRKDFDACTDNIASFLVDITSADVVINCIGVIPQRSPSVREYIQANTLLPLRIEELSNRIGFKFIHITTDCVFDGKKGAYNTADAHTSDHIYGITKSLGEPRTACVIRTSIIGEERSSKKNLLEWVLSNRNGEINGYTNHIWNGVTCLALARVIRKIIDEGLYWKGVKHIASPDSVSKYELCQMINTSYNLNIVVHKCEHPKTMNMTLADSGMFEIESIDVQIAHLSLYNI